MNVWNWEGFEEVSKSREGCKGKLLGLVKLKGSDLCRNITHSLALRGLPDGQSILFEATCLGTLLAPLIPSWVVRGGFIGPLCKLGASSYGLV